LEPGDEAVIRIRVFRQDDKPTSVGVSVYPPHTTATVPELGDDVRMVKQFDKLYTERTGREVVKGQRTAHARQAPQDALNAFEIAAPPHAAVPVLGPPVTFHDHERPPAYWAD